MMDQILRLGGLRPLAHLRWNGLFLRVQMGRLLNANHVFLKLDGEPLSVGDVECDLGADFLDDLIEECLVDMAVLQIPALCLVLPQHLPAQILVNVQLAVVGQQEFLNDVPSIPRRLVRIVDDVEMEAFIQNIECLGGDPVLSLLTPQKRHQILQLEHGDPIERVPSLMIVVLSRSMFIIDLHRVAGNGLHILLHIPLIGSRSWRC